jgi:FixJ family two-component response regulator
MEVVYRRILIIEDNEQCAATFQRFLNAAGYVTDVAGDFTGGIELLTSETYGVIFLDINLKGSRTGIGLLKEIRRIEVDSPVVIMTGSPEVATAVEALRCSAFDYLCKPVEKEQLLAVAAAALQRKAADDAKEQHCRNLERAATTLCNALASVDGSAPSCGSWTNQHSDEAEPDPSRKSLHAQLSERERQVLYKLGHGESSADIAAAYNISVRTVETYFARIIEKLTLGGMKELKQVAIRNNLPLTVSLVSAALPTKKP